jgi:hypothetical protein
MTYTSPVPAGDPVAGILAASAASRSCQARSADGRMGCSLPAGHPPAGPYGRHDEYGPNIVLGQFDSPADDAPCTRWPDCPAQWHAPDCARGGYSYDPLLGWPDDYRRFRVALAPPAPPAPPRRRRWWWSRR